MELLKSLLPRKCNLRALAVFLPLVTVTYAAAGEGEDWIPRNYHGVDLDIRLARDGERVSLGEIIFTPRPVRKGASELVFSRDAISKEFVDEFFSNPSSLPRRVHPLAAVGVESILKKESLVVRLHNGVVFHLRNGMPRYPEYRTFTDKNLSARLRTFGQRVHVGRPKIANAQGLADFFLAVRPGECEAEKLPSGETSYTCIPGEYFPGKFEPRVE